MGLLTWVWRGKCNVEHTLPFNTNANTQWSYTDTALTYRTGVNIAMFLHHFLTAKWLDHFLNCHILVFIARDAFYLHSVLDLYERFWLIVREAAAASYFFLPSSFPWSALSSISSTSLSISSLSISYLYLYSFTVFIFCIFFITAVLQNFMQLFTHKTCFTNNYVSIVEQFDSHYTITYGT